MITLSVERLETTRWQRELAEAITDPTQLLRLLDLDAARLADRIPVEPGFPLRVTRHFAGLMRRGDPDDPLLAQVLPRAIEALPAPGFGPDPVADFASSREPGILHKYRGRALLLTTGACAVHCRYCFRRHFPYADHSALRQWPAALAALRQMPDINELILSGGDPLTLSDRRLARLVGDAATVGQLRRLRIHTRLPVVLPSRVTADLTEILASNRLPTVLVIHANHPNEVGAALRAALEPLRQAGITLLNQAVLLKSVNDEADTLVELSEALFGAGVIPYYLHLLDPVAGAAHFEVPLERARRLLEEMRVRLPGYLVPRVVRELPGLPYKTPVS